MNWNTNPDPREDFRHVHAYLSSLPAVMKMQDDIHSRLMGALHDLCWANLPGLLREELELCYYRNQHFYCVLPRDREPMTREQVKDAGYGWVEINIETFEVYTP